ncbi:MAG: phosphoribosylglycinamide formyltransferase [Acidobacteria bacterium]|nr:phosphoribosylglycinamide formyltransferase [Acidobacteriota bacterium]
MTAIGVLISGRGSNMLAILDAIDSGRIPARVECVISNVPDAPGLGHARERGLHAIALDHRGLTREAHDRRMHGALAERGVDLVCLAGYMRLLSPFFIRSFPNRILNIHPSLLPAFPGLAAQRQALDYGVKVAGCTVHIVDEELDHGPIVLQRTVEVRDSDTEASLAERILAEEHIAYPEALRLFATGRVRVAGRKVVHTGPPAAG